MSGATAPPNNHRRARIHRGGGPIIPGPRTGWLSLVGFLKRADLACQASRRAESARGPTRDSSLRSE
ncbi:MAG: hypothetical protein ABI396_17850 [Ktedonobacteraceae bacterium]